MLVDSAATRRFCRRKCHAPSFHSVTWTLPSLEHVTFCTESFCLRITMLQHLIPRNARGCLQSFSSWQIWKLSLCSEVLNFVNQVSLVSPLHVSQWQQPNHFINKQCPHGREPSFRLPRTYNFNAAALETSAAGRPCTRTCRVFTGSDASGYLFALAKAMQKRTFPRFWDTNISDSILQSPCCTCASDWTSASIPLWRSCTKAISWICINLPNYRKSSHVVWTKKRKC